MADPQIIKLEADRDFVFVTSNGAEIKVKFRDMAIFLLEQAVTSHRPTPETKHPAAKPTRGVK